MLGVMLARLPKERKADALSKLEAVESNVGSRLLRRAATST